MAKQDVTKKDFPSFDDLFGGKEPVVVEGGVEEMEMSDLGFEIAGEKPKKKK